MYHKYDFNLKAEHHFCATSNGVTMYYVTEEDIIRHGRKYDLNVCYNGVQTVPGTRSYHCFTPHGDSLIMKKTQMIQ